MRRNKGMGLRGICADQAELRKLEESQPPLFHPSEGTCTILYSLMYVR